MKKTHPCHTDTFELIQLHKEFDPDFGIMAQVKRSTDNKTLDIPLAELRTEQKKTKNHELEKEDINLQESTVTVQREAKNKYRFRTIPVPLTVTWLFRNALQSYERIAPFVSFKEYSKAVKRRLIKWNPGMNFSTKDLRNTLQTEAIDHDWNGTHVQRYVGHSPKSTGERHYYGDETQKMIAQFREKVVARVDEQINSWDAPEDTSVLPYPRLVVNQ